MLSFSCSVMSPFCNPVNCSTPDFPVLHYIPEFAQTHVHWVSDAVQPSHPLLPPSPPAFNLSQHPVSQFSASGGQVLELQLQHQSLQWIFKTDCLEYWLVWSPCSPRDSRVFSNTTVQKHQTSALNLRYSPILTSMHDYSKNHSFKAMDLCWQSNVSAF